MKKGKTHLKIADLSKNYKDLHVLNGLNLEIHKGEFIAIVGKSGCGKSTLLRLVAGLEEPSNGAIFSNGKILKGLNEDARIMFQDGRLLPWKRVVDNIGLGLAGTQKQNAIEALKNVGLEDKANEWPAKLSGGQKQRVALARALLHKPGLLLLDEPLGALDALTRLEMQALIEEIWLDKQFTSILVTHDVDEAVAMADRIILLEQGKGATEFVNALPRPRQRNHPMFSSLVETIRTQILGTDKEKSNKIQVGR